MPSGPAAQNMFNYSSYKDRKADVDTGLSLPQSRSSGKTY